MAKSKSKSKGSKTAVTFTTGSVNAKDDPFANLWTGKLDFSKWKPAQLTPEAQSAQTNANNKAASDAIAANKDLTDQQKAQQIYKIWGYGAGTQQFGNILNSYGLGAYFGDALFAQKQDDKPAASQYGSFYDSLQSNWERLRDYALDAIRNSAAHSVDNQNETSDAAQQNAYVSYMNGKKDLNDTLAKQGITGGGSETTNLKADTDYQNNRGSIESLRSQAIQKINQQLESDIADKSVSMSESEMSALQNQYNTDNALAEQKKEHADSIKIETEKIKQDAKNADTTKHQNLGEVYMHYSANQARATISTIEGWKKSNPQKYKDNAWKLPYLRAAIEIDNLAKANIK